MLNMIKGIINQKKDFLEAAEIILEDGMGNSLDDTIILGEDSENIPQDNEPMVEEETKDEGKDEKPEDEEKKNDEPVDDSTDIMDTPIDGDDSKPNEEPDTGDITNEPIGDGDSVGTEPEVSPEASPEENPLPLPGDDSLPNPVSNVTGEPVADDNLLSMEIDLSTNTPKDVLPVPPANAGDAVVSDDLMNQRIDSGFGGEDGGNEPPMDTTPVEAPIESGDDLDGDLLSEAITIADPGTEGDAATPPAEETPPTEGDTSTEPTSTEEETPVDNDVTAAVKDKVAEADSLAYDGDPNSTKEELMKKLSNITKSLEDAKRAVMSAI